METKISLLTLEVERLNNLADEKTKENKELSV